MDAQPARATGVSIPSAPADGTAYAAGETVTIALAMSEPVLVTGTPRVRLGVGGAVQRAAYVGPRGAATSELRFAYTVQAGDFDSDGLQICSHRAAGCGRIALDGGTVRAASDGTDADLRHPEQDADADDKVDARVTTTTPGSPYGSGEPSEVKVPSNWALTPSGLDGGGQVPAAVRHLDHAERRGHRHRDLQPLRSRTARRPVMGTFGHSVPVSAWWAAPRVSTPATTPTRPAAIRSRSTG